MLWLLVVSVISVISCQQTVFSNGKNVPQMLSCFFANVSFDNVELHGSPSELDGIVHFRNIPGAFPNSIHFHFDGLTHVMKIEFKQDKAVLTIKPYESLAYKKSSHCLLWTTGSFHFGGLQLCSINPGVNLLPIDNEIWLTIDTAQWGRMSLDLETLPSYVDVPSFTLNAHPACDNTGCYVTHSCSKLLPISSHICISKLVTSSDNPGVLSVETLGKASIPLKLIQHSHSPCITKNFIVVKVDAFTWRSSAPEYTTGFLKYVHQEENNLWAVLDRRTNQTRLLTSEVEFVNNHFWNCFEEDGEIVVDSVMATEEYLDQFFPEKLSQPTNWDRIFFGSWRCRISQTGDEGVNCEVLTDIIFDYPTFNPLVKTMNTTFYKHFYAVAPKTKDAKWFDSIVKMSSISGRVETMFYRQGHYFTEPTFVPLSDNVSERDDDGALITVAFDSLSQKSKLIVLNARDMTEMFTAPLPAIVPFHAHGISFYKGKWFTNP